jgi:tRNA nucleotidyltransferase (CCA-adding enzyme)
MKINDFADLVFDSARRDLTINSMAAKSYMPNLNMFNDFVDPYNGYEDLRNRVLRHTSEAFAEDPVRVLRLARFRARMGAEWTVADETVALISTMSKKGVLSHLQPDRIWKEFSRAMMEPHPRLFFDTLLECDALHTTFPVVYKLLTALESHRWHPEGNAYEHTMLVLTAAAKMGATLEERFACICHDLGKGLTPFDKLPKHYGHDVNGVPLVAVMAKYMSVPSAYVKSAEVATRHHMRGHELDKLKPATVVRILDDLRTGKSDDMTKVIRMVFMADHRGRLGHEDAHVDFIEVFDKFVEAYKSVKFNDVVPEEVVDVKTIKPRMEAARVKAVAEAKKALK